MRRTTGLIVSSFIVPLRRSLRMAPQLGFPPIMASSVRDFHQPHPPGTTALSQSTGQPQASVQFSQDDPFGPSTGRHRTFSVNTGTYRQSRSQTNAYAPDHTASNGLQSAPQSRRPSSVNTAGGTLKRRITRSKTIRAYHVPTGSNWEPGAEPGIDTSKDSGETHGLHEVSRRFVY